VRFTGPDSEIDVRHPGGGKHKPEFSEWRWERFDRLPDLVVPFKRTAYLSVVDAFADLAG
jgi:putative (di)nucleoside polyphosphate hydrolase